MTILMDTVAWDEAAGLVMFQVSDGGKTYRVRYSDVFLQDGFSCQDPETEYQSCILGHTDTMVAQITERLAEGTYPDGATLDFLDL